MSKPGLAVTTNDEVECLGPPDRAKIISLCCMPSGIPKLGSVSTHSSRPLVPALLARSARHLDKHSQIDQIVELGSSSVDAFDDDYVASIHSDGLRQATAGSPVEAAVLCPRPLREGEDRFLPEPSQSK
jgi:hypothetical protein